MFSVIKDIGILVFLLIRVLCFRCVGDGGAGDPAPGPGLPGLHGLGLAAALLLAPPPGRPRVPRGLRGPRPGRPRRPPSAVPQSEIFRELNLES